MVTTKSIRKSVSRNPNSDKGYRVGYVRHGKVISVHPEALTLGEAEAAVTGSKLVIIPQTTIDDLGYVPKDEWLGIRAAVRLGTFQHQQIYNRWNCKNQQRPSLTSSRTFILWILVDQKGEVTHTYTNEQDAGRTLEVWKQHSLQCFAVVVRVPLVQKLPIPANL